MKIRGKLANVSTYVTHVLTLFSANVSTNGNIGGRDNNRANKDTGAIRVLLKADTGIIKNPRVSCYKEY